MGGTTNGIATYPRRSLHGQIANDIGLRIVGGDLPPGASLPNEETFSAELGISRTALREAIKVLAGKGLVESRPRTGTRVRPRSAWNMLDPDVLAWQLSGEAVPHHADDLMEARRVIEPAAAAMAALRARPDEIAAVAAAYADMERLRDDDAAAVEADLRFHLGILAASHNAFLRPMGALIQAALRASFRISKSAPGAYLNSMPFHRAVLDAVRERDPERARAAMDTLLALTTDDLHRALGRDR